MEAAVAGTSSTASQSQPRHEEGRAGPLPKKRGEIGYVEEVDGQEQSRDSDSEVVLPPRHPADRDPEQGTIVHAAQVPANAQGSPAGANPNTTSTNSDVASSIDSVSTSKQKGHHLLRLFKCKNKHKTSRKIAGITLPTLLKFVAQTLLFSGTIVAWAFVTRLLQTIRNRDGKLPGGLSSTIFMHVVFGIAVLAQLLLLERRIYRIRAERYSHLHPGEILPSFRNRHTAPDNIIALSPWNRPPLPTYAAVLAQSGRGTGDVEDHLIVQQPPPAYGNTRGSTFLLSGPLSTDLRLQRPASVHSTASMPERPKSYVSRDEEWEVIQDAERARRLEETLARLERSTSRSSRM